MESVICHYDVIPLLNKVFHKAFGRVEVNQRAISDRGWGPLNRKLLEHPHLVSDNSFENNSSQSSNVLLGLNIANAEGMAGLVLDRFVKERVKNEAAKQAAERRLADGKNMQKNIKDAKRLSAGVLAKNVVFALDNVDFIARLKVCQDREKAVKLEKARRKKNIIRTNAKKLRQLVRRMDTTPFIILKNYQWTNVELTCNISGSQKILTFQKIFWRERSVVLM